MIMSVFEPIYLSDCAQQRPRPTSHVPTSLCHFILQRQGRESVEQVMISESKVRLEQQARYARYIMWPRI